MVEPNTKPRCKAGNKAVTVSVGVDAYEKIKGMATAERRSVSAQGGMLLEQKLEDLENPVDGTNTQKT